MTARPHLDERDPQPPTEWHETSSAGIRRMALQAAREAVSRARARRTHRQEEEGR